MWTIWAPECRLLFLSVLQVLDLAHLVCGVVAQFRDECVSLTLMSDGSFFSLLSRISEECSQSCSSAVFDPKPDACCRAAARESGGGLTLLLEDQCETRVHTQQVFGGHLSSSVSAPGFPPVVKAGSDLFGSRLKCGGCHGDMKCINAFVWKLFLILQVPLECVCVCVFSGMLLGSYWLWGPVEEPLHNNTCSELYDLCFSFCNDTSVFMFEKETFLFCC